MNEQELRGLIQRLVLSELARTGQAWAPVMSSNRHCHLSQQDVERLFGAGYRLTKMRDLVQPGQFACNEKVTLETPKGSLSLRVVGPARKETQVELSLTDCAKVGIQAPIRLSGQLENTPGCTLRNGEARVTVPRGVIVAARHLHMSPEEAEAFGLRDGDVVSLRAEGPRALTMDQVIIRSGPGHVLEAHIDKDEANACGLLDGALCRVLKAGSFPAGGERPEDRPGSAAGPGFPGNGPVFQPGKPAAEAPERKNTMLDLTGERGRLITEAEILSAGSRGIRLIRYGRDAILTPLARDAAREKGIELAREV